MDPGPPSPAPSPAARPPAPSPAARPPAPSPAARQRRNSNYDEIDLDKLPAPHVIFHKPEKPEYEEPPRYDASRKSSGLAASKSTPLINQARLSEVMLEDARRELMREAARAQGGWDIGQRPTSQMSYFEFPPHQRVDTSSRNDLLYESAKPGRQPRYLERRGGRTGPGAAD